MKYNKYTEDSFLFKMIIVPTKPKDEMNAQELEEFEHLEMTKGPHSLIHEAIGEGSKICVFCANRKKLIGYPVSFDRHMNLLMIKTKEIWIVKGKNSKYLDRFIGTVFLRGDCVVSIVKGK